MSYHNPGGVSSYLSVCAQIEHFFEYRQIVRDEIEAQVPEFLAADVEPIKSVEKMALL